MNSTQRIRIETYNTGDPGKVAIQVSCQDWRNDQVIVVPVEQEREAIFFISEQMARTMEHNLNAE